MGLLCDPGLQRKSAFKAIILFHASYSAFCLSVVAQVCHVSVACVNFCSFNIYTSSVTKRTDVSNKLKIEVL